MVVNVSFLWISITLTKAVIKLKFLLVCSYANGLDEGDTMSKLLDKDGREISDEISFYCSRAVLASPCVLLGTFVLKGSKGLVKIVYLLV